jgi:hypothetical protein
MSAALTLLCLSLSTVIAMAQWFKQAVKAVIDVGAAVQQELIAAQTAATVAASAALPAPPPPVVDSPYTPAFRMMDFFCSSCANEVPLSFLMLMQGAGGQRLATLYDVKVFTKRCASGLGGVLFASDDQTSVDEALNEMLYCLMRPEAEWNRFLQNGKHPNRSQRPQNYPANLHLAGMTQSRAPQRKQPQPARLWVYVDWSNISLGNQVSAERLLLMILRVQHGHPMCKFAGAKVYICTHTCVCTKLLYACLQLRVQQMCSTPA